MANVEIKANQNGPLIIAGTATYVGVDGQEQTTPGAGIVRWLREKIGYQ